MNAARSVIRLSARSRPWPVHVRAEHFGTRWASVDMMWLVFPPWHPDGGKMAYQARRDKHRATPRKFRVVNATAAHDFVLEVPGETGLFVLLDVAGQTNIAATAHRDVQRRRASVSVLQSPRLR